MIVYKLRHKATGLFWKGGGIPTYRSYRSMTMEEMIKMKFSKDGKLYHKKNQLTSGLKCQKTTAPSFITKNIHAIFSNILHDDCEIVEFKLIETTPDTGKQFICPCCGSNKVYVTEAIHCNMCAITTEI